MREMDMANIPQHDRTIYVGPEFMQSLCQDEGFPRFFARDNSGRYRGYQQEEFIGLLFGIKLFMRRSNSSTIEARY